MNGHAGPGVRSSAARTAFTTSAPRFAPAELEALLLERYGLQAATRPLTSERDLTVRVEAAGGESFVLKIANAAEDPAITELQTRALQHVAAKDPDVPASRVVPTTRGEAEFVVERDGERHVARLLTFLPGTILCGTPATTTQMRAVGAALGRLARALADFSHPAADHEIVWDIRQSPKLAPLTAHVCDPTLRARVDTIFARFRDEIGPSEAGFRRQVVHNDFNPFNLLVDPDDTDRLTGILDFGDLVSTPAIYDLAVACAYQIAPDGHPLRNVSALVSAYHAVYPLPTAEVDALFDLIAVRQAMTIAITEWRAALYPENAPYILRNHARAKASIERCAAVPRAEARRVLRAACGFG